MQYAFFGSATSEDLDRFAHLIGAALEGVGFSSSMRLRLASMVTRSRWLLIFQHNARSQLAQHITVVSVLP